MPAMEDMFEPGRSDDALKVLRNSFGRFATGVTIVTMRDTDSTLIGLTVNSFSSVSLDPPLVLWSIGERSRGFHAFQRASHFCISVLSAGQSELANTFSRPDGPKFDNVSCTEGLGGAAIIDGAIAAFECEREALHPGGDHVIVVGRIKRVRIGCGEPLLFYQGRFRRFADEVDPSGGR